MAARIAAAPGGADDAADIAFLVRHLGLRAPDEALDIVSRYYPAERIPPRTQYLLEDIFAAIEKEASS
jgi:hypothetical protein